MLCEMTDSHYNILDALDKMCVFTNSREPRSAFDREIERVDLDLREWNDKVVHMWIEAKIELKMRALEQRRIMKKKKKSTWRAQHFWTGSGSYLTTGLYN